MKSLFAVVLSVALLAPGCASPSKPPTRTGLPPHQRPEAAGVPGTLRVTVTGIPSVEGQLFVELYDQATYFHYDRVLNEQIVPVTGREMTVSLEHVPPGRYLVAVSHDANANHAMDTGWLGIPKEAYGFSRGARGSFGPPDFASGAFDFDGSRLELTVAVR